MLKQKYACSLDLAYDLIGGKWRMRVLWHIFVGNTNYTRIQKYAPDITPKMLAETLRDLEDKGLIHRKVIADSIPVRVEYSLSDWGKRLIPSVLELNNWTKQYAALHNIEIPIIRAEPTSAGDGTAICLFE
ncbi:MAG: helix-turn-helix domain-containing protein [Clostridia bacterium]|nr:helix-turn-helix domain-containing protein [Clostridia bacterium]